MSEEVERRIAAIEERLAKLEEKVFQPQASAEMIEAMLDAMRRPIWPTVLKEPE
ncbi:MAG: hypothetical protein RJA36_849 [Pseudomonadota bacterium]|jgi:hypothetical protein